MRVVAISDVHGKWNKLTIPPCNVLVSTGDYSFRGEKHMVKDFHTWLNKQPADHIISVQGNHEVWVEQNFEEAKLLAEKCCPKVHFIGDHGTVVIDGIKFHGSAITPWFYNWAWNRAKTLEEAQMRQIKYIKDEWDKIPIDTNILLTHGPVYGILDQVPMQTNNFDSHVGCQHLFNRLMQLENCKIHICGHIHYSYGSKYFNGKQFYNASICDEQYMPINPITIIDY